MVTSGKNHGKCHDILVARTCCEMLTETVACSL